MASMFQQNLQDLVKGIRSNRRDEDSFMRAKFAECAEEARKRDPEAKATAILKLTYLQLFGYSFSNSSFQVVEVMSRPEFSLKRIGYFAAAQSFSPSTDVLLLTTNQFKKDLAKGRQVDCSLALSCLAKICTDELGRDTGGDVKGLLNSARPYVKKKALLTMYKITLVCPHMRQELLETLHERLEDSDNAVICAVVTVLCELAVESPNEVLPFAPALYSLLKTSKVNWIKIKVLKLMGVLCQAEPRLAKKLVQPITDLINHTEAKALLYECCNTVTLGLTEFEPVVELAVKKLGKFIVDNDQNLKYLGLTAMSRLARVHPHLIRDQRDLILDCFDDADVGIRTCALKLITCLVTKSNYREVAKILLRRLSKGVQASRESTTSGPADVESDFLCEVARSLLDTGTLRRTPEGGLGYLYLHTEADFSWYIRTVLFGLAQLMVLFLTILPDGNFPRETMDEVADQLVEIPARVDSVRGGAVECALRILSILRDHQITALSPLVASAAFVIGENADILGGTIGEANTERKVVLQEMLAADTASGLNTIAQLRIIHACFKIFTKSSPMEREALSHIVEKGFLPYHRSPDPEVQERSMEVSELVRSRIALSSLFRERLRPQDGSAQKRVSLPEGLDMDLPLATISDVEDEVEELMSGFQGDDTDAAASKMRGTGEDDLLVGGPREAPDATAAKGTEADEDDNSTLSWVKRNELFYISDGNAKKSKAPTPKLLDVDGTDAAPDDADERKEKAAAVFISAEEIDAQREEYQQELYASLATPKTGRSVDFPAEGVLIPDESLAPALVTTDPQKASKKKKKKKLKKKGTSEKRLKAGEAQAVAPGPSTGELLIDLDDEDQERKLLEQNRDLMDLLS